MSESGEAVDAIVVGASLCGLITAYQLDCLGYRVLLLEKGARIGGANTSFRMPDGSTFDLGMHVLDELRSELTTRLFVRVMDGAVQRTRLRRGMVLRGATVPYNAEPRELPAELRELLPSLELRDELGAGPPTREHLRQHYGRYADFVLDEVLPSFRCEQRHKDLGVDERLLLANVYPWFFPRAERPRVDAGESRRFHDRLRRGEEQHVLYPREGGFAGFAQGFLRHLGPRVEVLTDLPDLHLEVDPATHRVEHVRARGRRFTADHVFWCARWEQLLRLLGMPCPDLASDHLLLGSFRLDRPAAGPFNEILVGDPSFEVDRISFPGRFAGTDAPLLQVEFAFPVAQEDTPLDPEHWLGVWSEDLGRLGLIGTEHRVESFDMKCFRMHYNSFGAEGVPLPEPDPGILHEESNLRPVAPTYRNRNLNGSVPLYLEAVLRAVTEGG